MAKDDKSQEQRKSQIEQMVERVKKNPLVYGITVFALLIIGIGSFTGALANIPANIAKVVNDVHPPTTPTPTPVKLPPQGTILYRHIVPDWGGLLAWSPDGKRIANTTTDGTIQTWDATTGQNPVPYSGFKNKMVTALAWSYDSTRLVAASSDGSIQIWIANSGATDTFNYSVADIFELVGKQGSNSSVHALAWSPKTYHIAFGDNNGDVVVVDLGEEPLRPYDITVLKTYQLPVYALAWSPDGNQLVVSSNGGMDIWNVASSPPQLVQTYMTPPIMNLAWSPNGKYIAAIALTAYAEAPIVWDTTKQYSQTNPPQFIGGQELSLAWACDSNRIALGGNDAVTL